MSEPTPKDAPAGAAPTSDPFWIGCMSIAAAAAVWAIWSVDYIPTNDGPQHVLQGHIENHYKDPGTIYAKHLEHAPQYASKGFALLFVPLERFMPWQSALRVSLSIMVLAVAAAFTWLTTSLHRDRRPLALLGFVFAFSWPFYMGFWPFVLGSAIGIATAAFVLSRTMEHRRDWLLLALLLTAQSVLHVVSALFTVALLAAILAHRPSDRLRRLGKLLLTALPVLVVVGLVATEQKGGLSPTPLRWEQFGSWVLQAPRLVLPGPTWRALLWCASIAAALVAHGLLRRRGQAVPPDERALFAAALGLLGLAAVVPFDLPGWQFFSPRLLFWGSVLGLALLPIERLSAPGRRKAMGALTAVVLVSCWVSSRLHRQLADGCADALAGLALPIERRFVQLPVTFNPFCGVEGDPARSQVPHLAPLRHMSALYAASHGGTVITMFNGNASVHAFVPRAFEDDLPIPERQRVPQEALQDPRVRSVVLSYFAGYGAFYESLLMFGVTGADMDNILARGFTAELRRDTFLMARFAGCPVELVIPRPPARGVLVVEHGVWPVTTAMRQKIVERPEVGPDGSVRMALERTPCGALWAYVAWREGRSTRRCAGAPPEGILTFEARGERTTVECTLDGT